MMKKKITILCLCALVATATSLQGCNRKNNKANPKKNCLEIIPEKVKGLKKLQGPRTETNIIRNMVPFVCRLKALYKKQLETDPQMQEGMILFRILVEFQGEVSEISVQRHTFEDDTFVKKAMMQVHMLDFNSYGEHNSETGFLYPVRFSR